MSETNPEIAQHENVVAAVDSVKEAAENALKRIQKGPATPVQTTKFLSTGCALLNCAMSGRVDGGFALGTYNLFVGDSRSGKTLVL